MARITYIEHDGEEHVLEVESGVSVMQGAVRSNLRGILAECGGSCMCGTCHVYVEPSWLEKVGPRFPAEELLLEGVCDERANSRLACQIEVTPALDGLVIYLPELQV